MHRLTVAEYSNSFYLCLFGFLFIAGEKLSDNIRSCQMEIGINLTKSGTSQGVFNDVCLKLDLSYKCHKCFFVVVYFCLCQAYECWSTISTTNSIQIQLNFSLRYPFLILCSYSCCGFFVLCVLLHFQSFVHVCWMDRFLFGCNLFSYIIKIFYMICSKLLNEFSLICCCFKCFVWL